MLHGGERWGRESCSPGQRSTFPSPQAPFIHFHPFSPKWRLPRLDFCAGSSRGKGAGGAER